MREIDNPGTAERLATHNTSIDEEVAAAHRCAQVHLPTGRTCTRPAGHWGSCSFEPAEQAHRVARHDA